MDIAHSFLKLAIVGLITVSGVAHADAPRYDSIEFAYQSINKPSDSGYGSDMAYGLNGSYAATGNLLLEASYAHEHASYNLFDISGTASGDDYGVGVGYRFALTGNVDIVPRLLYENDNTSINADAAMYSQTNTGYDVGAILRAMTTDALELDASLDHSTVGIPSNIFGASANRSLSGTSTNILGLAALYSFEPKWAIGASYTIQNSNAGSTGILAVNLRYYFE